MWDRYVEELGLLDSKLFENMPDFFIISPPKTGTTWLFENLKAHPEVYLPDCKEIRYFSTYWQSFDINWYFQHFQGADGFIYGEASPSYSILPRQAIQLISRLKADLKLIFLMRDPIERAWSHAKHNCRFKEANFRKFEKTIENVPIDKWVENFAHSGSYAYGDYRGCLRRWLEFFPKNQFYVGFFEDIKRYPQTLISEILEFIGVRTDIDFSEFPLSKKIFEGLKLEMSPEVAQLLRALYRKKTQDLEDFLKAEFSLKLPNEWGNTLIGKEIEEPIVVVRDYRGWSILLFQNVFYAVNKEKSIDDKLIEAIQGNLISKNNCSSSLFQLKLHIALGLLDNELSGPSYEIHKKVDWKRDTVDKAELTEGKYEDIWLENILSEEVAIGELVRTHCGLYENIADIERSPSQLQQAKAELEQLYAGYQNPTLIEDFGRYNIVAWRGNYYGMPKELGQLDISSVDLSQMPGIFIELSPEKLKNSIQAHQALLSKLEQAQAQVQQTKAELEQLYAGYQNPTLIEDFGQYNIVAWRGSYYGLPKKLGQVDISSTDLTQMQEIFIELSPERLKSCIQNHFALISKQEGLQSKLQQTQGELHQAQSQAQQALAKLAQAQTRIQAMESSKFWRLRQKWIRLKQTLWLRE